MKSNNAIRNYNHEHRPQKYTHLEKKFCTMPMKMAAKN